MSADFEELEINKSEAKTSADAADPNQPDTATASSNANLGGKAVNLDRIQNIKVKVEAVLGGVSLTVAKLMELKKNEVIVLDKEVGSTVDVLANGNLIARGEIVVIEGDAPKFGISLSEIVSRDPDSNIPSL